MRKRYAAVTLLMVSVLGVAQGDIGAAVSLSDVGLASSRVGAKKNTSAVLSMGGAAKSDLFDSGRDRPETPVLPLAFGDEIKAGSEEGMGAQNVPNVSAANYFGLDYERAHDLVRHMNMGWEALSGM